MTERDPRFLSRSEGTRDTALLHLRFEGRSRDIALDILDVGVASPDENIRVAVARFLDVPENKLRGYVVERHENGNMTLRPEAVFG
jgi:hypothetical protein